MGEADNYDVIIIGAGPGGYVAGIRASQLGLKACVIEKDKPGGVCLNAGCIPTKSIIHQAEVFLSCSELKDMGVAVDTSGFDYKHVFEKSRKAVETLSRGVEYLLKKNNVELIKEEACIISKNKISLGNGTTLAGKNILIATGSRPKKLHGFEFDEKVVLSSTGALFLTELPEKLMILGAGTVGCEFASIMNAFGVEVCLVEILDHILPMEDEETVSVLERSFRKKGISIMTDTSAVSMDRSSGKVSVTLEEHGNKKRVVSADKVLVVVGRVPNTDDIGLENVGLRTEDGYIPVGDFYRTEVDSIFAVGDVVPSPLLAHVASREGEIAVEYMAGLKPEPKINPDLIPSAVFTEPQIAGFGLTERKAREEKIPFEKAVFPYRGIGKAVANSRSEGLAKVLFNPSTKEILGAHIAGHNATELIHEILLARTAGLTPKDIVRTIHAHPTLSELVSEVMRAVDGQAIHV